VIYVLVAMTAMVAFASLGVDVARVQLAKTELRRAADAAARHAAMTMPKGSAAVRSAAVAAAGDNKADGVAVVLATSDVQWGKWDPVARMFTKTAFSAATAVEVTAERSVARGNAVPLMFARLLGRGTCDVKARAVCTYSPGIDFQTDVPATSNPWLAGMPSGTIANPGNPANKPDKSPAALPKAVTGVPLVAGQALTFDSIDGGANNFSSNTLYTPDGNTGWVVGNMVGNEHGKSNLTAPINAVVAVFLDDQVPTSAGPVPPGLNFSTEASRDFASLSPKLRQPFFIGDGRRKDGTVQSFVVPQGATRLFIGIMDEYEWNNNVGKYTTTIHRIPQVTTVK
jgi:hypothetical protein